MINKKTRAKAKPRKMTLKRSITVGGTDEQEISGQKSAIVNLLGGITSEKNLSMIEKEKLSMILHSIGDAVIVVDQARKIILFNRAAELLTGYLTGEVIGRPYQEVIKMFYEANRSPNLIIEEVFKSGKTLEMMNNTILINKYGKEIPISDNAAPIKDRKGRLFGCIVFFRDVTREREVDRQKTEFISVASHQLRAPLTSVKWFLEMLLDGDAGKLNKEQLKMLEQVYESSERMIGLVNKLLNISRIESGHVAVNPVSTNLNMMIIEVMAEMASIAKQRSIKLTDKSMKLPLIQIDPKLVREIFMNLISNSIKYSNDKSEVILSAGVKNEEIIFSIKDKGIGIPKREQGKIFNKFFRADNAATSETEGTGMGLYVAKHIVELSGGRIWFKSEEHQGTTFFFTLPLKGSIIKIGEKTLA